MTTNEKIKNIVKFLDDKKALDIKVLKVGDLTVVSDYFILVTGTSNTHIKALCDEVEYQMGELGESSKFEGKATDWLLLDFSDIIVHIFLPDAREHYNLERLWADAQEIEIEKI